VCVLRFVAITKITKLSLYWTTCNFPWIIVGYWISSTHPIDVDCDDAVRSKDNGPKYIFCKEMQNGG
jgi:hypothetical protein